MGIYLDFANNFNDATLEELKRNDLGIWNFEELMPTFRIIRQLLESADLVGEQWIPNEKRGAISSHVGSLTAEVQRIRDLTQSTSNPNEIKTVVIRNVTDLKDGLLNSISPYVRLDINEISNLKADVTNSLEQLNEAKKQIALMIEEWDARQSAERVRNVEVGTSEASSFFDERAEAHENSAKNFGISSLITAGILLGWTILVGFGPWRSRWDAKNPGQTILNDIPKIAIITLLSFALGIFVKNYRINQHLFVLNQTKSTTLKAGESFVKSVKDDSTRDIVLEAMVRSVFALGDTGFLDSGQERQIVDSPNLSSILRAIGNSGATK